MRAQAKKSPDFLSRSVIYQMFLRSFNQQGTLSSAMEQLPFLADLGIDIVYLCPIFLQDDDERVEFWSKRQIASELNNPQNPYRIKDYNAIDPEYGTDDDLKKFVVQAHKLGMRVMLDLVYYHCGPTAVFIEEHPDYVKRDEAGNVLGNWNFPELNFESDGLREYLWKNMEYLMTEFDVDGYRCDVGSRVPLSFWEEGRRRIEAIKPDCIMLCEADSNADDQLAAFDMNYGFHWGPGLIALFKGEKTVEDFVRDDWQNVYDFFPEGSRLIRYIDNHDIANDCGKKRHEKTFGEGGVEAATFADFMIDGIPFLYNGEEIADTSVHSIYGNRFYGHSMHVDWSNLLTAAGRDRLEFIRSVIELRHSLPALSQGKVIWLKDSTGSVLTFIRECDEQRLIIVVNTTNELLSSEININSRTLVTESLIEKDANYSVDGNRIKVDMLPHGYLLLELN